MRFPIYALGVLLALALALAGCHEQEPGANGDDAGDFAPDPAPPGSDPDPDPPAGEDPPESDPDTTFRTLAEGQQSGHREEMNEVFTDEAAWESFWENHTANETPPPQRPAVDFTTERVVAVVLGDRPDGCYYVRITDIVVEGQETRVEITEYTPTADDMCIQVVTQPFHFIAIAADETSVVFSGEVVEGHPDG